MRPLSHSRTAARLPILRQTDLQHLPQLLWATIDLPTRAGAMLTTTTHDAGAIQCVDSENRFPKRLGNVRVPVRPTAGSSFSSKAANSPGSHNSAHTSPPRDPIPAKHSALRKSDCCHHAKPSCEHAGNSHTTWKPTPPTPYLIPAQPRDWCHSCAKGIPGETHSGWAGCAPLCAKRRMSLGAEPPEQILVRRVKWNLIRFARIKHPTPPRTPSPRLQLCGTRNEQQRNTIFARGVSSNALVLHQDSRSARARTNEPTRWSFSLRLDRTR